MFRERGNRMNPHSGGDIAMYAIAGVLGVLAALTGLAMATTRVACGGWATPSGIFDVLGFLGTRDGAAFGETSDGCAAGGGVIITVWVVFLLAVAGAVVALLYQVRKYRQSDKFFIAQMRRRDGLAKRSEIASWLGRRAAKKMTGTVRPTLAKKDRTPEAGNIRLGRSEGVECWIGLEESVVLIGPPRSGKGMNVIIGAILDAPGPVITTSSRADNYAKTAPLRSKKGPVTLFDPQGLTGQATTLRWSPITGSESPQTANQRASSLIGAAGLTVDGSNSEWRAPAVMIMQCLLHAAAISGSGVEELMRWGNSPSDAKQAVSILREHEPSDRAAGGWAGSLEAVIDGDPKMRTNQWFGVSNAVQGLSVGSVRECLNPRTRDETFDIDSFIENNGTLYIVGTKTGGTSAGPFLIAMMDAITERAREIAARREGNRLDPPLSLPLDEIANITSAWEGLVQLMADGGGVGISAMPVFQSLAQVRDSWGKEAAEALFDAATVKIQLGGASNKDDLEIFQKLAGPREIMRSSRSRQKDGSSISEQIHDKNVFEIDELRRLPFGWAIVLFRKQRPIFMQLRAYPARKDAGQIKAADTLYASSLQDPALKPEWERAVTHQATPATAAAAVSSPAVVTAERPAPQEPEAPRRPSDEITYL